MRTLLIALVVALSLGLVACKQEKQKNNTEKTAVPAASQPQQQAKPEMKSDSEHPNAMQSDTTDHNSKPADSENSGNADSQGQMQKPEAPANADQSQDDATQGQMQQQPQQDEAQTPDNNSDQNSSDQNESEQE